MATVLINEDGEIAIPSTECSEESTTAETTGVLTGIHYVIVDEFDSDDFVDAVSAFRRTTCVSLAGEGINLCRKGELLWLMMCLSKGEGHTVYLFDIAAMGDDAFDEGLRHVLENNNIQKITHDCRFLSDILRHKYRITMTNVWDTQVAHVLVERNETGILPETVKSLADLTELYMNVKLPDESSHDENVWATRPLSAALGECLAARVYFLWDLRWAVTAQLNRDLHACMDQYVGTYREDDDEIEEIQRTNHLVTTKFEEFSKRLEQMQDERRQLRQARFASRFTATSTNKSLPDAENVDRGPLPALLSDARLEESSVSSSVLETENRLQSPAKETREEAPPNPSNTSPSSATEESAKDAAASTPVVEPKKKKMGIGRGLD